MSKLEHKLKKVNASYKGRANKHWKALGFNPGDFAWYTSGKRGSY